ETANIGGIPLRFVDTAGIRDTRDEAESIGVRKSLEAIADSDLRLLVVDSSQAWTSENMQLLHKVRPLGSLVIACNKCDLPVQITAEVIEQALSCGQTADAVCDNLIHELRGGVEVVWTSALRGDGLAELRAKILETAAPGVGASPDGEYLTNLR